MKSVIIDIQRERRETLESLFPTYGVAAKAVEMSNEIASEWHDASLVLLHVGDSQDGVDPIAPILERFTPMSWILCYSGGSAVDAATDCTLKNVALFGPTVDREEPEVDFLRMVTKIVEALPYRETLPETWLRETVRGFDLVLEAKLEVLSAALEGVSPPAARIDVLKAKYPSAFRIRADGTGMELKIDGEMRLSSITKLRSIFFHEESIENDELLEGAK